MDLYVFPPRILIHVSNSDWCANGPFFIPELGLYALFYVQILLFRTYKMIKFIIILSHIVTICIFKNLESILETKSNYGVYYMIIFKLYYL